MVNWTIPLLLLALSITSNGQSVKGGRGIKGGSSSHQTRQWSTHGTSFSEVQEKPFERQTASQSMALYPRACDRPVTPTNGRISCRMMNEKYTCTVTCNVGYKFPDDSTTIELECSQLTGQWSPLQTIPDCIGSSGAGYDAGSSYASSYSREFNQGSYQGFGGNYGHGLTQTSNQGNSCLQPISPMNGAHYCSMANGQWSCQGTCNPGYEFPDRSRQLTITCNDRDGKWLPVANFEDCSLLCHPPCENGGECSVLNQCICPSTHRGNRCQYAISLCFFQRLTSSTSVQSDCKHTGEYTECHVSCQPGMSFQPPTTSLYRCTVDGLWNPPTAPQCRGDVLCKQPPSPMNGRVQCQGSNEIMICRGTCRSGYVFPDGFTELSTQCVRRTGEWAPHVSFPDCEPICNPGCENGGKCLGHNSCLCTRGFRGERCQYPTTNCDAHDRFASVAWNCKNGPTETLCNISCGQTGSKLQPAQPKVYSCSLDGRWQPDLKPICVTDYSLIDRRTDTNGHYQERTQDHGSWQSSWSSSRFNENSGNQQFGYAFEGQQKVTGEFKEDQSDNDYSQSMYDNASGGRQTIEHNIGGEQTIGQDIWRHRFTDQQRFGKESNRHVTNEKDAFDHQLVEQEFVGQRTLDHDFGGQQTMEHDFGGQQIMEHDFGGQQTMEHDFRGQETIEHDFGNQRTMNHDFGGQETIEHDFGGQRTMDHDFGGQQTVEHDFSEAKTTGHNHESVNSFLNEQINRKLDKQNISSQISSASLSDTNEFSNLKPSKHLTSESVASEQQFIDNSYNNEKFGEDVKNHNTLIDPNLRATEVSDSPFQQLINEDKEIETDYDSLRHREGLEAMDVQQLVEKEHDNDIDQELGRNAGLDLNDFSNIERVSDFKGVCSIWGFHHYRTFDGGLFTFPSTCQYILTSICGHDDLIISLSSNCDTETACDRTISIQVRENRYQLSYNKGLVFDDEKLSIPTQLEDLTVEKIARYIVARLAAGFTVWLNEEGSIVVTASTVLKNRTCGLCGKYVEHFSPKFRQRGGAWTSDIFSFANSWKQEGSNGVCIEKAEPTLPCSADSKENRHVSDKANLACAAIYDLQFEKCKEIVDADIYYAKCQMDCCSVQSVENCECSSIGEFVLECSRNGGDVREGWRQPGLCPLTCSNGTVYNECGPPCAATCAELEPTCEQEKCVDGCHCPEGTVLEDGQCTKIEKCPCHHGGDTYQPAEKMQQDCNTCVCQDGKWQCTDSICPSTCFISGSHITTFDGLGYDFQGRCPHYLVDSDDFNIQLEYGENCKSSEGGVCVRGITIHTTEGAVIKLKLGMEVSVNGREMLDLPIHAPGINIGQATSTYMRAELTNGLEIFWNLEATIQINAPVQLFSKVRGLCGTFNKNQADDFYTPEGDVEKSSNLFARKWMLENSCAELLSFPIRDNEEKLCDKYSNKRLIATNVCSVIKGSVFEECHKIVDYDRYYYNCLEDVCGCESEPEFCSCLSLSNYASACAKRGKILFWRQSIPSCGISCSFGQIYHSCTNPCSYSCSEIAHISESCEDSCVEGCVCPPGQTLNEHKRCVPISTCSCYHSGHLYPPEFLQRRGKEMCECAQGHWECHEASASDIFLTPVPFTVTHCDASLNFESTDCASDCPLTCSNFHHHQPCSVAVCVPGCRCQKFYVLESTKGVCVLPQNCPCHHGGQNYDEGQKVETDCNTCTCEGGLWQCDSNTCSGLCSAWGDSHYETFDGNLYDFHGECSYVLLKTHSPQNELFSVVVQNVPCGARSRATCGKSVSVTLGDTTVTFTRDHPLPEIPSNSKLSISSAGLFTLISTEFGISIQWDRDTRVYVTAQPMWKNKLKGLCGDFNADSSDDFQPPSGGAPLVLAKDFADSWRVHKFCRAASKPDDACDKNPERRAWARHKCSVLKSDPFRSCHFHVEVEDYYERCVSDACACSSGGDCECLCAVVSAYAQKCARNGVIISWRSQDLCPIQCEACDHYSPCISLCPPLNCDNYLDPPEKHPCSLEPCVEGCEPKPCPAGQVRLSSTNFTCVPEESCQEKPCIVVDGVAYKEGERIPSGITGDSCQSCYCHNGEVDCIGVPCTKYSPAPTVAMLLKECEFTGWTEWINSVDPEDHDGNDKESIHDLVSDRRIQCTLDHVRSVQCRSAANQEPSATTGQMVVCDESIGLQCNSSSAQGDCLDYEMRVYCQCSEKATCPPGETWHECAFDCDKSCQSLLADLKLQGVCSEGQKCVPGCIQKKCAAPTLARDASTCVTADTCTCKLNNGITLAPGEVVTNGCEKCQCLNNSLICSTTIECKKPEEVVTETFVAESSEKPACQDGWTEWMNQHTPDSEGEKELLEDLYTEGIISCNLENVTQIECRDVEGNFNLASDKRIHCNLASRGMVCLNNEMPKGMFCKDYEVRAFCSCPGATKARPEILPAAVTEPYEVRKITMSYVTRTSEKSTSGIITTPAPCAYWSDWINKSRPRKGPKFGDRESTRPHILKQTEGFCLQGKISAIECQDSKTGKDYRQTKEEKLLCDLSTGFRCSNKHQPDGRCQDYKIRYFCACGEESTRVPIRIKPTTPLYVYPCSEFVHLVDGLSPLPDANIKASSSFSPSTGPQAIRIGSQKAWTPVESNEKQFVEVNFGSVRTVYGVLTKGSEHSNAWVTSYQILYSDDGHTYSYYQDNEDVNKVFSGNFDGSSEVKHILNRPFEAKYVRLEPLSWEEKIVLRMDLLGCAEAIISSTEPLFPPWDLEEERTVNIVKPSPLLVVCKDPMGLENGLIMDSQISASSSYSAAYAPDQARFGSDSIWAAASSDKNQYIQVDFIDLQNISGIITKGREDIPQWVTAYIIGYSNNGLRWSKIMDQENSVLEFSANYDQFATVTNMFPATIRARFLRIFPTNWKNWISMKMEILGCYHPEPCRDPMGLENGIISNHQLSASSENSELSTAADGRLSLGTAWSPENNDKDPYLQIDLLEPMKISGIISKGDSENQQWVKSFFVSYSNDSTNWKKVQSVDGRAREFTGNKDEDSPVINPFPIPINSRYVRVLPTDWHQWISMKMELLGCVQQQNCRDPMGFENGMISNGQITASSASNTDATSEHVRISDQSGWQPNSVDPHPYIQVDFLEPRNVSAVVTKGVKNEDKWVTEYKILYSDDGKKWSPILDQYFEDVIFQGNSNRNSPVTNTFAENVEARFFRLIPLKFENAPGLRMELLGCYHSYVCQEPLGMENGAIFDFQISSSSYLKDTGYPVNARLDSDTAWIAENTDSEPFLKIDLLVPTNVTGVITRGRNDANEWVKVYRMSYSLDGIHWQNILKSNSDDILEFQGNVDNESPVSHLLPAPVFARYVRIIPTDYEKKISMRIELLGCYVEKACMEPMGLENGLLAESQITASSYKSANSLPSNLQMKSNSAWSPASTEEMQYIQVDFGGLRNISAVVTKGHPNKDQWVSAYEVTYSNDGDHWITVEDEKGEALAFPGNNNKESAVTSIFPEIIEAQYIRINPKKWENWIALRAEVLGCYHPYEPIVVPEEVFPLEAVPTVPMMVAPCPNPMEAESSLLKGGRLVSTSAEPEGDLSRIYLNTRGENGLTGGWVPKVDDLHPVLMAEFPETMLLTSIYIQGRDDEENWVKTLRVIASPDNHTWLPVFGPNGNEMIEGNSDQNSVVGHYFKKPVETKFVKVIPESWHRWPSFRMDLRGCHLLEVSTVAVLPVLCPTLLNEPNLVTNCPDECPTGHFCDGKECVDPLDCPCVHEGKIFKVGDRLEDRECKQCLCALGGQAVCSHKVCPSCAEDELVVYTQNCSCSCQRCKDDEFFCPANGDCIPMQRRCDGIIDCPNDEINCPTTSVVSTTEVPTTVKPLPENATCDILGKHIKTFDGQDINYEICHHVILRHLTKENFNITAHKDCDYTGNCKHWLEIFYKKNKIKVSSDLEVELDGHSYTASQLRRLKKRHTKRSKLSNLSIEKVGEQVIVKSLNGDFMVTYDVRGHVKVEITPSLQRKVVGLCGFYSGNPTDDQQKPDGFKAYTAREFGDSWALNTSEKECAPVLCPHEEMTKALELCNKLKEEPFLECGKVLSVNHFIEYCMSTTCECLKNGRNSNGQCKCDSFQAYVEACEETLGPMSVRNWRLRHECQAECPPGLEWNDCGPSCQLTCESTSLDSLDDCSEKCIPGCFCPPGTVLNEDVCIPPNRCADEICQGFGDPHFKTFDGLFFPFQASGTFLIVSDKENNFVIKGITRRCGLFTIMTCLIGLDIEYKEMSINIRKDKEIRVNNKTVSMDKLPFYSSNAVVLGYPGRTFIVVVPQIGLEARYYEENSGFAVKVPSKSYFNKTIGLCGNCNGQKDDELKEEPLKEFVCSWQTEGDNSKCKKSFEELPEIPQRIPLCTKLDDVAFEACHPLVDVEVYIDACSFDAVHSGEEEASLCKTAMEYARQCCQAGVSLENWPEKLGCDSKCPEGLQYHQCHKGCPQTCVSMENNSSESLCNHLKTDGCFCSDGEVLKNGSCVNPILCKTCDEEGHVPGDTWNDGNCKKCNCRPDLMTECVLEVCPAMPVCSIQETLVKQSRETTDFSCCEKFTCVPKEEDCPPLDVPKCEKGEMAKVYKGMDLCPKYKCECDPVLCPPLKWPDDLEIGQKAEMVNESCCPFIGINCHADSCPERPDCANGLELSELLGECCTVYKCKPPKDVCVYTDQYKIVGGFQEIKSSFEMETKYYEVGKEWKDGLCEKCSCVESKGQLVPLCLMEQCPTVKDLPENKDYVLHEYKTPGKCCPDVFRIQCRDEEGNIHEAGEQWSDENDPCVTYLCEETGTGDVRKSKSIINCTECPKTAVLFPPSKILGQCCGICKVVKCEEDDVLYSVGDTWSSNSNPCRTAECVNEFGKIKTIYTRQPCLAVPKECPKDKIVQDENRCCEICNITSEISCSTAPIPLEDTIGFFTYENIHHGGICVNEKPAPNVLKCSGACHSSSYYSLEDGEFKDMCKCCKVNVTIERSIELRCPDGSHIFRTFLQPETCQCSKCAPKETISTTEKNNWRSSSDSSSWIQSIDKGDFHPQRAWEPSDFDFAQKPYDIHEKYTQQEADTDFGESWPFQQNQVQQQMEDDDY